VWCETGDIPVQECCFSCFGFLWWHSELAGSAIIVSSWQMLCGGRSPTVVVELITCRWLKYVYFVVWLENCYCIVE
jgi:hypothetical protein